MEHLPSKKLFLILIPTILVLAFVFSVRNPHHQTVAGEKTDANLSLIGEISRGGDTDSDGDGLKDWEETLWGMDPKKEDSDGDGVLDVTEVAQMKERGETPSNQQGTQTSSSLSKTELLTQKIFGDYMSLKQQGTVTNNDLQTIASRGISTLYVGKTQNIYTMNDLRVATNPTTQTSVLSFANNTLTVLNQLENKKTTLTGLRGLEIESKQYKSTSLAIADIYTNLAKDLLRIEAPKEIAITYLSLVNSYAGASAEFRSLANGTDDPALIISSVQNIKNYASDQDSALLVMDKFFESQKITLLDNQKEYGVK